MKKTTFGPVLVVLMLGLQLRLAVSEDLPKPFTFARYQTMTDRSPFAVATKVEAPAEAPNFAKDLFVANAAKSKEGDMVTIASSTDKNFKKYLTTGIPMEGYSIVSIEWSETVGETKVTISKDGQSATLGFNQALLRQPGQAGGSPVAGGAPPTFQPPQDSKGGDPKQEKGAAQPPGSAAIAAPPAQTKPMPVPMVPTPQPRVRGVIPRNPGGS